MPLMCNLTNPEPYFLSLTHEPKSQYFSDLIIPGPTTRQLGTTPPCLEPFRIIQTSQSSPVYSGIFAFLLETPVKVLI